MEEKRRIRPLSKDSFFSALALTKHTSDYDKNINLGRSLADKGLTGSIFRCPSQIQAFQHADSVPSCNTFLRVFSAESHQNGGRSFLAAHEETFWHFYQSLPRRERHFYEIIREKAICHMYFDLEFTISANKDMDGNSAVNLLVMLVSETLQAKLGIKLNPERSVLELDSSTDVKFSRHLIMRIPGAVWLNNAHAGAFIRMVLQAIVAEPNKYSPLQVKKEDGTQTFLIDTAVYTRNRAFRLFMSSKREKGISLRATRRWAGGAIARKAAEKNLKMNSALNIFNMPPVNSATDPGRKTSKHLIQPEAIKAERGEVCEQTMLSITTGGVAAIAGTAIRKAAIATTTAAETISATGEDQSCPERVLGDKRHHDINEGDLFSPSLPCSKKEGVHQSDYSQLNQTEEGEDGEAPKRLKLPGTGWGQHGLLLSPQEERVAEEALFFFSLISAQPHEGERVLTMFSEGEEALHSRMLLRVHNDSARAEQPSRTALPSEAQHYEPSPFPGLEQFILSVCAEDGIPGQVRSWVRSAEPHVLYYNIRNNRWCDNIGRQHKSNGIFFAVDIAAGVWWRKCYDPECRSYQPACLPLPPPLWQDCKLKLEQTDYHSSLNS